MKVRLVVLGACIIFSGFGFTGCTGSWGKSVDAEASSQSPTMISDFEVPSEVEQIPLYPGAKSVVTGKVWNVEQSHTSYEVDAPRKDIVAFYKEVLVNKGWVLKGEGNNEAESGMGWKWSDGNGLLPYHRELGVRVVEGTNGEFAGRTFVDISLKRIPDPEKIPVYPGATQIKVDHGVTDYEQGLVEDVTTYLTDASPSDVADYYKRLLPQFGYRLEKPYTEVPDSLLFVFADGGPEAYRSTSAFIITKQDTKGMTQVELRVR